MKSKGKKILGNILKKKCIEICVHYKITQNYLDEIYSYYYHTLWRDHQQMYSYLKLPSEI